MQPDLEKLFDVFAPPFPPSGLRERTLLAAGSAFLRSPRRDNWEMVWRSVWIRLVWSAGVAVLLINHVAISGDKPSPVEGFSVPMTVAAGSASDELAEVVDLPKIKAKLPSFLGSRKASEILGRQKERGET